MRIAIVVHVFDAGGRVSVNWIAGDDHHRLTTYRKLTRLGPQLGNP